MKRYFLVGAAAVAMLIAATAADGNVLDSLQREFRDQSSGWFPAIERMATNLLLALAVISLAWAGLQLVLKQGDLGEFVGTLVRQILMVGFFLVVIQNAMEWTDAIVRSFGQAATEATGSRTRVGAAGVLERGAALMGDIWARAGVLTFVLVGLCALAVMLIYAAIAAYVLIIYAEVYVVTAAGVLLLGFGGSEWTMDYARRYLTYVVSVGAKLYVLFLVVGIGDQLVQSWLVTADLGSMEELGVIVGMVFVLMMLVLMIPNMVQGVVNGSSIGSVGVGGLIAGTMSMLGSAAGGALRGGMAVREAGRLTAAQAGASTLRGAAQAAGGGAGGAGRVAGGMAKNLATAAFTTFAGKVVSGSVAETLRGQRLAAAPAAPSEGGTISPGGGNE